MIIIICREKNSFFFFSFLFSFSFFSFAFSSKCVILLANGYKPTHTLIGVSTRAHTPAIAFKIYVRRGFSQTQRAFFGRFWLDYLFIELNFFMYLFFSLSLFFSFNISKFMIIYFLFFFIHVHTLKTIHRYSYIDGFFSVSQEKKVRVEMGRWKIDGICRNVCKRSVVILIDWPSTYPFVVVAATGDDVFLFVFQQ